MKVFLSIDFGIRYMGISIGNTSHCILVSPLSNYTNCINWHCLLRVITKWSPSLCVVGYSFNFDSFLNRYINLFIIEFFYLTSIPVIRTDEFMSTFFFSRKNYGYVINSYSSFCILKDFLFDV